MVERALSGLAVCGKCEDDGQTTLSKKQKGDRGAISKKIPSNLRDA